MSAPILSHLLGCFTALRLDRYVRTRGYYLGVNPEPESEQGHEKFVICESLPLAGDRMRERVATLRRSPSSNSFDPAEDEPFHCRARPIGWNTPLLIPFEEARQAADDTIVRLKLNERRSLIIRR